MYQCPVVVRCTDNLTLLPLVVGFQNKVTLFNILTLGYTHFCMVHRNAPLQVCGLLPRDFVAAGLLS